MYDNKSKHVDKKRYKRAKRESDLPSDLRRLALLLEFLSTCVFFLLCVFSNRRAWRMNSSVK